MEIKTFVCNMIHENCFVVSDEDSREAIVIDPGCYTDAEKQTLARYIGAKGLKVTHLLCTHLHFDHIFGVPFVEDTFGVQLEANDADTPWIAELPQHLKRFGIRYTEPPRPIGHILHHGDQVYVGKHAIQCLSTPGHSAGSLSYYIPDAHCVFSGDALFQQSIGRTDFFDGSYEQLIRSIRQQLCALPDDTVVYCGHGMPTTIGEEKTYNPYI